VVSQAEGDGDAFVLRELYNLLWYPALPFAMFAARPHDLRDLRERLGRGHFRDRTGTPRIWIHAASVGEIEAIRPISEGLMKNNPGAMIVLTTMTTAGREAARRRVPDADAWMLAPLDATNSVRTFLAAVRPTLVVVAETELWPNYFFESSRVAAKIAIVNGRMSERSLRRYLQAGSLFKDAVARASLILAQSNDDARRYHALGVGAKVVVTGNTKLDGNISVARSLRPELHAFAAGRPILVAGSTAPGEEAAILAAYSILQKKFPELALAIAPRHLDRVPEIEFLLHSALPAFVKASKLDASNRATDVSVLLLDTMGELRAFYDRAAIAFVGGSLAPERGGQNPAEPASCDVPVLFGPYHENQREIAAALVEAGGARIVATAEEIASACEDWLRDDASRIAAGRAAGIAISQRAGGAQLALTHLQSLIDLV
jgi:3-deoxy-D-manno-octulosonic-acid transferase